MLHQNVTDVALNRFGEPTDRIGQEVRVFSGDTEIYAGKWMPGFYDRVFNRAYRDHKPISVHRARDNQLLFQVQPTSIWLDENEGVY